MPGRGGLGGATSSSVESGSSSVDCDMLVVLFKISISLSVRGSSDWLRIAKNLVTEGYRAHRFKEGQDVTRPADDLAIGF